MHGYKDGGWKQKYNITKADGSPCDPEAVYFVLRLDVDPHARTAMMTYALSVEADNPKLSVDIWAMLSNTQQTFVHNQKQSQPQPTAAGEEQIMASLCSMCKHSKIDGLGAYCYWFRKSFDKPSDMPHEKCNCFEDMRNYIKIEDKTNG